MSGGVFSTNELSIALSFVNCSGDEDNLLSCPLQNSPDCPSMETAAIICQGLYTANSNFHISFFFLVISEFVSETDTSCNDFAIRLVNGSTIDPLEGRVEVCINNAWGTICDTGFSTDDAEVICRQLGYPFSGIWIFTLSL